MPLKINVGVARKESKDYNSKGYTLNIEAELPASLIDDANGLADATNRLYQLADDIIDERIRLDRGEHLIKPADHAVDQPRRDEPARTTTASQGNSSASGNGRRASGASTGNARSQSEPASRPHTGSTSSNATGNGGGGRGITQAQLKAIRTIASKQQQDPDALSNEEFGLPVVRLTVRQASDLISLLKGDPASTAGGRR